MKNIVIKGAVRTPMAKIIAYASVGVDPKIMGISPIYSTQKALQKSMYYNRPN